MNEFVRGVGVLLVFMSLLLFVTVYSRQAGIGWYMISAFFFVMGAILMWIWRSK